MTKEEMKRLVEEHYDSAINDQNLLILDSQLNASFIDHGMPPGTPPGPNPAKKWLAQLKTSFPDLRVNLHHLVAEEDIVAVRATWRGTHSATFMGVPPTGRIIEFTGAVFWRVDAGQLAERWPFIDRAAILEQLKAPTDQ
ncbi:MAG: ester cyclase [Ardenticatenaceae bacterium]|nr:ester cyclase [Ardenticatenaceae bacterium]